VSTDLIKSANLLVELLVEELPPKALKRLGAAFALNLYASLNDQGLIYPPATISPNESERDPLSSESFASPRRLATLIRGVRANAPEMHHQIKLMPVSVGLDANGDPSPALLKKLRVMGFDAAVLPQLKRASDGKTETLFFDTVVKGATLAAGLQKSLEDTLAKLPIPKVMTYQLADGWSTVNFVRPAHGLVALHGADVVSVSALGLTAGRTTQGHRFEAASQPVSIRSADSYETQMEAEGAVIPGFAKRRADIERQLQAAADKVGGGVKPIEDEALLDEVTALVERPNVLLCQFEPEFLKVPQECLILTMKANQKYFPLLDANGKLTNKFLIVSNISPADTAALIGGNERVVRARLADGKFFFDKDRKKTLESRVRGLDKVVYHNKLGVQGVRVGRVRLIARAIAHELRDLSLMAKADRAALLAKADLLTGMVGEFPELQGIMGRYYALHDGEDALVAEAIEDHYKPRFAGDELPRNDVGVCVALADKLETLVGLFSIGEKPTGEKDPFALRRHALGIIRLLVERKLPLSLDRLLQFSLEALDDEDILKAWSKRVDEERRAELQTKKTTGLQVVATGYGKPQIAPNTKQYVIDFIFDRLAGLLREQGFSANEVEAVLSMRPSLISLVPKQLNAVRAFAALPESASLSAANKRVGNILKKVEGGVPVEVNTALFKESAETALFQALSQIKPKADGAFESGDYTASLQALAALKAPVDAFFDGVMVNSDDPALKANRLALLNQLHQTMNRVADLSRLAA
jgi:glycyl-tRNA synthetase beta chain